MPEFVSAEPAVVLNKELGEGQAQQDIANGNARILYFGLPSMIDVDRKTGLPHATMGCIITADAKEYVEGYNSVIVAAFDEGRLSVHSYLDRMFDLPDFVAVAETIEWTPLASEGDIAVSTTGRGAVLLTTNVHGHRTLASEWQDDSGDVTARRYLFESPGAVRLSDPDNDPIQIAFAHEERTALIRFRAGQRVLTYDLEHGRVIQSLSLTD